MTASIRSLLQNPATPRNTKRISRKASKPPRGPSSPIWNPAASTGLRSARSHFTSDVFACPPPAQNSFSHRDTEPAEVGIPFIRSSSVCSAARSETDLPVIPDGWERITPGRARHAPVQGRVLAGSTPRQGFKDRKFSTKDTNDTKPTHATLAQAVAPGPEGRQMIAQRVSAGFRPP